MIYFLLLLIGISGIGLSYSLIKSQKQKRHDYLNEFSAIARSNVTNSRQQIVDMKSLSGHNFVDRLENRWKSLKKQLGQFALIKVAIFFIVIFFIAFFINNNILYADFTIVFTVILVAGTILTYRWLQERDRKVFEESFPVALNMLTSAVSAGESITQAISYVGETLDGNVADEFRIMGQRLQLGESPEDVFRKSCLRFPYPSFFFFIITLRANMERGGQLKDIIQRLNRLMFNSRAVEKKKYAMTSEARASAKIVAAIPFVFLIILKFISPANFEYIMFEPNGRLILYYMLISESIGILIIWGLMKSVR
jgi:tight adherence protein B